ncbi:hypothetical protein [Saccharibacillus sp. JS10]|uniref:hypothetical protein n=1 Tax=Saccharibacillus sp. JS10 TaxID=2950552 RepID=UPI00210B20F1|nr:hypothetical protein [Saccharibacillus sp. JS10]MCQ4086362.1 hypothetical protein [Saccharibacillus sp. JS10]
MIQLTEDHQTLSNPDVKITPVYYLTRSKKVQFGLSYNKQKYHTDPIKQIPDQIFHVIIKTPDGKLFETNTFTKTTGVFDEFQRRSIDVDLDHQKSITVTVSLVKKDGETLTPIESASFDVNLD